MTTVIKTIGTGKDYSTITAWRNDLTNTGIYSSGDDAVGLISTNQVFNEQVSLDNGVTGLNSVTLTVDTPYRHTGVKGTGARIEYTGSGTYIIQFNRSYPGGVHIKWLGLHRDVAWVTQGSSLFINGTSVNTGDYTKQTVSNLICTAAGNSSGVRGCHGINANTRPLKVSNCVVYDILNPATTGGFSVKGIGGDDKIFVENCTVYNIRGADNFLVLGINTVSDTTAIVKNCLVFNITNTGSGGAACIDTATMTTSMTSDTTGTAGMQSVSASNVFVSLSPVDLHLKSGSLAIDVGTNLGTSSIDIDGFTRPTSSYSWDIGADEYTFPLNLTAPVLATDGTVTSGTWDSQSNGTISRTTYLRLASDDSLIATLYVVDPDFSTYVTAGLTYYVVERGSNDGGYDSAEDTPSADETIAGGGPTPLNAALTATLDGVTASSAVVSPITAGVTATLQGVTAVGSITSPVAAGVTAQLDGVTATSSVVSPIASGVTAQLDGVTASATAVVGTGLSASVTAQLDGVTASASVTSSIAGSLTAQLDGVTANSAAVSLITSGVTSTLDGVSVYSRIGDVGGFKPWFSQANVMVGL